MTLEKSGRLLYHRFNEHRLNIDIIKWDQLSLEQKNIYERIAKRIFKSRKKLLTVQYLGVSNIHMIPNYISARKHYLKYVDKYPNDIIIGGWSSRNNNEETKKFAKKFKRRAKKDKDEYLNILNDLLVFEPNLSDIDRNQCIYELGK